MVGQPGRYFLFKHLYSSSSPDSPQYETMRHGLSSVLRIGCRSDPFTSRQDRDGMSGYSLLAGIRVLEVAQLAPAAAGGHLADLGAEVIKVESGPLGDPVRSGGARAVGSPDGPAFMHLRWNRGKKSVRLDLRDEQGKAAFRELARESD